MKSRILAVVLGSCALLSPQMAAAQEIGDWVLSPWRDSDYYFPGVIVAASGAQVTVRFDDGTKESRLASDVVPFSWQVGSMVECQWKDGQWYDAEIRWLSDDGYTMQVRYEDGVVQRTNTGKCRST